MITPRVSIITPAYNVGEYLAATVDSALRQTYGDFEYLIVDDGSTDSTRCIAEAATRRDARIRVLTIAHQGAGAARNAGLREARGEFVSFLDGDDLWEPEFLASQLNVILAAPAACHATFCRWKWIDQWGVEVENRKTHAEGDYDALRTLVAVCPPGNGSSLMIRRRAIEDAGYFDETLVSGQDSELWYRMLIKSRGFFRCIPEILVHYRRRPGSLSNLHRRDRLASKDFVIDRYLPGFERREQAQILVGFCAQALRVGSVNHLRRWSRMALLRDFETVTRGRQAPYLLLAACAGGHAGVFLYRRRETIKNLLRGSGLMAHQADGVA